MSTLLRGAALGALLGAVWGIFLRSWMRLLVVDSEFTWSGTSIIVGCATAAGIGLGLVGAARRAGRSRWWRLAALAAAPLVLFPQGVMALLPALLLGGLVVSGRPARWLRVVLTVVALAPLSVLALLSDGEPTGMPLPILLVTLVTLMAFLAVAGAELFYHWPDRDQAHPASDTPSAQEASAFQVSLSS